MTTPERVRRFVTPFSTPLCDLPHHPQAGDTYTCDLCHTGFEATATGAWVVVDNAGGCPHPPEQCEPAGGNAAVGARTIANAWSCNTCGNWVVDADEAVVLA